MPSYETSTLASLRDLSLGARVDRASALASAQFTSGADVALFNVLVGRVRLNAIIGECMVQFAGDASLAKLIGNPTTGTSVDLCSASASLASLAAGKFLVITGTLATALTIAVQGAALWQVTPLILSVGTIDLNSTVTQTSTGAMRWTLYYVPLDDGAYVTAT